MVLQYRGGTYIGQSHANSVTSALSQWLTVITNRELVEWKISRDELSEIFSDEPIPLSDSTNVWCLSGSSKDGHALINVIATDQSTDEL